MTRSHSIIALKHISPTMICIQPEDGFLKTETCCW